MENKIHENIHEPLNGHLPPEENDHKLDHPIGKDSNVILRDRIE